MRFVYFVVLLSFSDVICERRRKQQLRSNRSVCALPEKPEGGNYEVDDCIEGDFSYKCRKIPGTIVDSDIVLIFSCDKGYLLPVNAKFSFCNNRVWDPEPPKCQKLCKALHSDSLELTCFYHGKQVNCNQPAMPETQLTAKCKTAYHIDDPSTAFNSTTCMSDGEWASKFFRCVPDCGIRNNINDVIPEIENGTKTKQFEFPWHAGLYEVDATGEVTYICGGTIIHPRAILTAAHCVYDDLIHKRKSEKQLRVAVGKHRSNWNLKEFTEQKFEVEEIIVTGRYIGNHNRYKHDIAILNLKTLIIFSSSVMPVCVYRDESLNLYKGPETVGYVVDLGKTKAGKISDVLLVANFSIYGYYDCREKVGSMDYISYDKFCGYNDNGTSVLGGGGLTFPRLFHGREQHFIYGIVSLKPSKTDNIVAFTNVNDHIDFINKVLIAIQRVSSLFLK